MNQFLFIVQGEKLAVFVNDALVLEYNELTLSGENNFFQVNGGGAPQKIDNFIFWNLDGVEINP